MKPAYLNNHCAQELSPSRPKHGGDILEFSALTGIDLEDCFDLSTGVAPWSYPIPEIPQQVWQALPTSTAYESELIKSAANYYGCDTQAILPVAGSQAAIEIIPAIVQLGGRVAYPVPGYEEHRFAWQKAGLETIEYRSYEELERLIADSSISHAVVINPNNPTAETYSAAQLEQASLALASRGGFLVVDEAFADTDPANSMVGRAEIHGAIVLRSTGKFFGLAGLRLGFVCASPELIQKLKAQLGLWQVSTVALWLGTKMLSDFAWIDSQKTRCTNYSEKLLQLVSRKFGNLSWRKSDLFVVGFGSAQHASNYKALLAQAGIHTRLVSRIDNNSALLRLGLANDKGLRAIKELSV